MPGLDRGRFRGEGHVDSDGGRQIGRSPGFDPQSVRLRGRDADTPLEIDHDMAIDRRTRCERWHEGDVRDGDLLAGSEMNSDGSFDDFASVRKLPAFHPLVDGRIVGFIFDLLVFDRNGESRVRSGKLPLARSRSLGGEVSES